MSRSFNVKTENLYAAEISSISNGGTLDSGWLDLNNYSKYKLSYSTSDIDVSVSLQSRTGDSGAADLTTPINYTGTFYLATLPVRQRYIRVVITNGTGSAVDIGMEIQGISGGADGASVFPLEVLPVQFSPAILNQSVIIGLDTDGVYRNGGVNKVGAVLTSDFKQEVARGVYDGYSYRVKFGRNPDTDTGSTPEDIYNGGGEYTGFNATSNENISVTSGDANDTGSLIDSGTATGGSNTTLIDSGATFLSSVNVGDLLINDTQSIHGIVTSVDSDTQVTVFSMVDGISDDGVNQTGDSYRFARSSSTGAAVLRLTNILDQDYDRQGDVYVILNGTTTVTTSGVNAMRCDTGRVVLTGSTGRNEGELTVTQSTTTSNVFCVIPTFGSTTIGCFTVPSNKDCLITLTQTSITRSSGAAGSATIAVNVRRFGQGFSAERVYELGTGEAINDTSILGPFPPGTDIKGTVESVSDNNTIAQISFEILLIDR